MTRDTRSHVWLCAQQELVLAVRSRWLQTFAAVFAGLSILVASSGYILSGGFGVQDFARTAVSLMQLVLLLVPLTALVFGVLELTPDRGAAELLFSQPVARSAILVGKLLGLFLALLAAQALGFGAAGLVIYAQAGDMGLGTYVGVSGASVVLTAIFLGVAGLVAAGNLGRRRSRALAIALVIWFVAVGLFDVAALGVASMLRSGHASRLLMTAVFVNPVDAIRTGVLLGIEGTAAFGAASLAFLRFTRGPLGAALLLSASLLVWLVWPTLVAARLLKHRDI